MVEPYENSSYVDKNEDILQVFGVSAARKMCSNSLFENDDRSIILSAKSVS